MEKTKTNTLISFEKLKVFAQLARIQNKKITVSSSEKTVGSLYWVLQKYLISVESQDVNDKTKPFYLIHSLDSANQYFLKLYASFSNVFDTNIETKKIKQEINIKELKNLSPLPSQHESNDLIKAFHLLAIYHSATLDFPNIKIFHPSHSALLVAQDPIQLAKEFNGHCTKTIQESEHQFSYQFDDVLYTLHEKDFEIIEN